MTRPIKFMAKYGKGLYPVVTIDFRRRDVVLRYGASGVSLDLDKTILYEFTGLLDKDGKEIYEGHKLAVSSETMDMIGGSLTEVVVGFENGSYMVGRNNVNHLNTYLWLLTTWNSSDCKIIGHIAEEG